MAGFCCGKIHHAAILSPAQPFLVGGLIDRADRLPDIVKERGAGNLAVYCAYSCLCFAATLTLILGLMCTRHRSLHGRWKPHGRVEEGRGVGRGLKSDIYSAHPSSVALVLCFAAAGMRSPCVLLSAGVA